MRTDRGALGRNACALRQSSAKFSAQCERVRMVCYVRLVCGTFLGFVNSQMNATLFEHERPL